MSFLITYPENKVEKKLREKLSQITQVFYCPLRKLQSISLDNKSLKEIRRADYFVITSPFAARAYNQKIQALNTKAKVVVLSKKMAAKLKKEKSQVLIAKFENQNGVNNLLKNIISDQDVIWLSGNLSAKNDSMPKGVKKVKIYENVWNEKLESRILEKISNQNINRILVTSPSSFKRLRKIEKKLPKVFLSPTYYTLGKHTASIIRKDFVKVISPENLHNVLNQMLIKMYKDELDYLG